MKHILISIGLFTLLLNIIAVIVYIQGMKTMRHLTKKPEQKTQTFHLPKKAADNEAETMLLNPQEETIDL